MKTFVTQCLNQLKNASKHLHVVATRFFLGHYNSLVSINVSLNRAEVHEAFLAELRTYKYQADMVIIQGKIKPSSSAVFVNKSCLFVWFCFFYLIVLCTSYL